MKKKRYYHRGKTFQLSNIKAWKKYHTVVGLKVTNSEKNIWTQTSLHLAFLFLFKVAAKQVRIPLFHFPMHASLILHWFYVIKPRKYLNSKPSNSSLWNFYLITLVFRRNSSQLSGSSSGNLQSGTLVISWRTASIRNSTKSFTRSSNNSRPAFEANTRFKTSLELWNNSLCCALLKLLHQQTIIFNFVWILHLNQLISNI